MTRKDRTAAQYQRQRTRDRSGRYEDMLRCYGGCGRPINIQSDYYSHPLTDDVDVHGEHFGDLGLALCLRCGKAAQRPELQTVAAFTAFIAANVAKRGVQNAQQK